MSLSNLYKKINKKMLSMNDNNKKIAQYFLDNWNNINVVSIKSASHSTDQSPATISRFCKEFGFEGFLDFRKAIMKINGNYVINDFELIFNENHIENMEKFTDQYFRIINIQNEHLKNLVENKTVQKFALLVWEANDVIICGMNINYNQTIDFKNKLISSGKNCIVEQDFHLLQALINLPKTNKLVITVSLSNENKDVIEIGKTAQMHGAKWIHISSKEQKYEYTPTLDVRLLNTESELWNLYSLRGGAVFNLLNLVFANYIIFHKNEKNSPLNS